jgi:hypothetical protein
MPEISRCVWQSDRNWKNRADFHAVNRLSVAAWNRRASRKKRPDICSCSSEMDQKSPSGIASGSSEVVVKLQEAVMAEKIIEKCGKIYLTNHEI